VAPGLLLALGLALPLAGFTREVARAPDGLVEIKSDVDLARIRRTLGGADPRAFVVPGAFRSPDFSGLEGNPEDYVHLSYLGFVILGCALLRARRRPSEPDAPDAGLFAGAVVCLVLSMGPVLVVDGHPLEVMGRALPLPWRFIEDLPGFDALSLLYRFAGPAGLCLTVLADLGVPRRWGSTVGALVALETLTFSPARHLPAVTPLPSAAPFETLAAAPEGAVINLPLGSGRTALYEQTIHEKPLAAGLNTDANRPALVVLGALRRLRDPEEGWDARDAGRVAEAQGIRYVVLHRNALLDDSFIAPVRALKDQFPVLTEDGDVRIWTLW